MGARGDAEAYKRFEAQGWSAQAASYEALTGRVTAAAAEPLLDAAGARNGTRVLDVACGSGVVTVAAAQRGATAVGIDLSAGMLERARAAHPQLEFAEGDAEALPYPADAFGAVVGGFVLNHLPRPERAVAEAARVLARGGRMAFSVWDHPGSARLMGIMGDAIDRAGIDRSDGVPPGPDGSHFAEEGAFTALLDGAGLREVGVDTVELAVEAPDTGVLWDGLLGGTVRAAAAVLAAPEADQRRVRAAFDELAAEHAAPGGGLSVPAVVKIGSGTVSAAG